MTEEEIIERLNKIRGLGEGNDKYHYDPEFAHDEEDKLYHDFVKYISTLNNHSLSRKAKMILQSQKIDFPRWCA